MSTEENKQLMRRGFEGLMNRGELALADELVSEDFLNHETPDAPRGPAGLRGVVTMLRTAFPDLHIEIAEVIAEGDKVAARTILRGTHGGPFMGIAPTGRRFVQEQIHLFRFADGKAIEHRAVRDDLGMLRQLDEIPAGDPAAVQAPGGKGDTDRRA